MGLEAEFYRGLSLLFLGDYPHAEQAFAEVARVLPLAEVVNNEGSGGEPPRPRRHVAFYSGCGSRPQRGRLPLQSGREPEAAREFASGPRTSWRSA